jgi:hypothetical protein
VTKYSDSAKCSGSNLMEPSVVTEPEGFPDNSNHLHRLVSEGDVGGVRLVHFGTDLPELAL